MNWRTIKRALEERRIHWHWQNLSDEPGRERGGFWYGRAWLRLGHFVINPTWHHGRNGLALDVSFDRDENQVTLHVAVPGASYFLSFEGLPRRWFERLPFSYRRTEYSYMGGHRSIGIRVHSGKVWASLWEDRHEWRHNDPKWMSGSFDVLDFLFGKVDYARRLLEERAVSIPMPEKSYAATAKLEAAHWIRPRWPWGPFSKRGLYVDGSPMAFLRPAVPTPRLFSPLPGIPMPSGILMSRALECPRARQRLALRKSIVDSVRNDEPMPNDVDNATLLRDDTHDFVFMLAQEIELLHAERDRLRRAAPVMLTVMALLADEADLDGLREVGIWYGNNEPEHLELWLDAEHERRKVSP